MRSFYSGFINAPITTVYFICFDYILYISFNNKKPWYNEHMPKHYDTILQNRSQGFRAGALVIKDNKVLLMHQIFNGEDFYTLPGGTWEKGETIEETCKREVLEEFGINVTVGKLAFLIDTETRIAFYFVCETDETELKLGGPEGERMNEKDQYYVEWLDINKIVESNFIPPQAKEAIIRYMESPEQPTFFLSNNK